MSYTSKGLLVKNAPVVIVLLLSSFSAFAQYPVPCNPPDGVPVSIEVQYRRYILLNDNDNAGGSATGQGNGEVDSSDENIAYADADVTPVVMTLKRTSEIPFPPDSKISFGVYYVPDGSGGALSPVGAGAVWDSWQKNNRISSIDVPAGLAVFSRTVYVEGTVAGVAEFRLAFSPGGSGCYTTWPIDVKRVDLDSDRDNDGDIDFDDERLENTDPGEIVRVDDEDDSPGGEDDLQYMKMSIGPTSKKEGVAWLTYDSSKMQAYTIVENPGNDKLEPGPELNPGSAASPNWNLDAGAFLPDAFFVKGKVATEKNDPDSSKEIVLHWQKEGVELADTNTITVTDKIGHYAYFAGIRDYLTECREPTAEDYKVFEGEIDAGGPEGMTHNLVAVLTEETTMDVHDARVAPVNKYWADVRSDFPNAVVIGNAGFFDLTWRDPTEEPPYAGQVKGICVEKGAQVLHSRAMDVSPPGEDPHWEVMGWVGQNNAGNWVHQEPRVEPPIGGSIDSAIGGLIAFYPTYSDVSDNPLTVAAIVNRVSILKSDTSHIMGWSEENVLFFIASKNAVMAYDPVINLEGFVDGLVCSGAKVVYGFDGGNSIALVHRDRLGNNLDLYGQAGLRHVYPFYDIEAGDRVSNYMIIKWK